MELLLLTLCLVVRLVGQVIYDGLCERYWLKFVEKGSKLEVREMRREVKRIMKVRGLSFEEKEKYWRVLE